MKNRKNRKKNDISLFARIIISNFFLVGIIVLITLSMTLSYNVRSVRYRLEGMLANAASTLSHNPIVIKSLEANSPNEELNRLIDTAISTNVDLSIITVADKNAMRIYHVNKDRIGQYFVGGDETKMLQEHRPYLSDAVGTIGYQRRAFAPVFNDKKEFIGFVMASTLMSRINKVTREIIELYIFLGIAILLISLGVSILVSRNIKKSLLGYEPTEFTKMYLARQDVFDALEEGILSVNEKAEIVLINVAASKMFNLNIKDNIGHVLGKVIPNMDIDRVLKEGLSIYNEEFELPGMTILCDKMPINNENDVIGAIIVLRNKTELTNLAEQLTGSKHLISSLRANTHDFMNKLHVVFGLLQMDKYNEAKNYIHSISLLQAGTISPILSTIENPTIAALILGKISRMKEVNIDLSLLPNSRLPQKSNFLSTVSLVSLIGNLLENAIDAININSNCEDSTNRHITMQISENIEGLFISVEDTGCGMSEEVQKKLFKQGYSTKGEHRGYGMILIKDIIDRNDGTIEIESEENIGTLITVTVRKKRFSEDK